MGNEAVVANSIARSGAQRRWRQADAADRLSGDRTSLDEASSQSPYVNDTLARGLRKQAFRMLSDAPNVAVESVFASFRHRRTCFLRRPEIKRLLDSAQRTLSPHVVKGGMCRQSEALTAFLPRVHRGKYEIAQLAISFDRSGRSNRPYYAVRLDTVAIISNHAIERMFERRNVISWNEASSPLSAFMSVQRLVAAAKSAGLVRAYLPAGSGMFVLEFGPDAGNSVATTYFREPGREKERLLGSIRRCMAFKPASCEPGAPDDLIALLGGEQFFRWRDAYGGISRPKIYADFELAGTSQEESIVLAEMAIPH